MTGLVSSLVWYGSGCLSAGMMEKGEKEKEKNEGNGQGMQRLCVREKYESITHIMRY
jgi:hypothetical protein